MTTGLAIILFVLIVAISRLGTTSLRVAMTTDSPVIPVFQAMIIVSATVVALVVTINQLVLAQEIGPLSDQRDRMSGAMEFLRNAEKFLVQRAPRARLVPSGTRRHHDQQRRDAQRRRCGHDQ
ncbi:hypothetical protein [Halalkalicoccus salilacus]|uniref:hypothetical protein n=1 Tax=Halalkalicoccus sp. GCM10025704 TaxID=3252662 RepID=UPI00360E311F